MEVEYGYCHCGCKEKTRISPATRNHLGYKRGEPARFLPGHALRGVKGDIHPLYRGGKKDREHRIIAEAALGKKLPDKSQVHHYDSNQLVICEDDKYHKLIHQRTRALRECGEVTWLKCNYCHKYDDPKNLYISPNRRRISHQECAKNYQKTYQNSREGKANV